jgi:hypothetical protein
MDKDMNDLKADRVIWRSILTLFVGLIGYYTFIAFNSINENIENLKLSIIGIFVFWAFALLCLPVLHNINKEISEFKQVGPCSQ